MESIILILFLIAIIEMIVSGSWQSFYFKFGIPIYKKSTMLSDEPVLSPDELSERFKQGIFNPIIFKQLSRTHLIFREAFFSLRPLNYTPVMHGSIQYEGGKLKLTCIVNWLALVFLPSFIAIGLGFGPDLGFVLMFTILPVCFFSILYLIQVNRYKKIFSYLVDADGFNKK